MARKLYPLGIQTFERIREENMMYIDNTEYVYRMTYTNKKVFQPCIVIFICNNYYYYNDNICSIISLWK